jgi:predicted RNA binding protein YcfA (HicA-like mRNA interferase family)
MTKLPTDLSGQDLIRVLQRVGFIVQRQRGGHIVLRRESPHARVVVPNHRNLRIGTLRTILHEANLTAEQLLAEDVNRATLSPFRINTYEKRKGCLIKAGYFFISSNTANVMPSAQCEWWALGRNKLECCDGSGTALLALGVKAYSAQLTQVSSHTNAQPLGQQDGRGWNNSLPISRLQEDGVEG